MEDMTLAAMVAEYNMLTGSSVKKFTDRATAERRLAAARDEAKTDEAKTDETVREYRRQVFPEAKIKVRVSENPKRAGSKSYNRFCLWANHMTVQEYLDECVRIQGGRTADYTADVRWDLEHGFIEYL